MNYRYRKLSTEITDADISGDKSSSVYSFEETVQLKSLKYRDGEIEKSLETEKYVEQPIKIGETLGSVAVKYMLPVSELKRINKLYNESDFFALPCLRLPARVALLHSGSSEESVKSGSAPSKEGTTQHEVIGGPNVEDESSINVGYVSADQILREKESRREAEVFLENIQNDLKVHQEKARKYNDDIGELTDTLLDVRFPPVEFREVSSTKSLLSNLWMKSLILALFLLLFVPMLYIIFLLKSS